ncbi:WD repeat UTP18 family protein [Abortiporus biennis]
MVKKRTHKRQKIDKDTDVQALGSSSTTAALLDETAKDDEERRLESMLFGTKYVPGREKNAENLLVVSDEDDEEEGGNELQNMMDSDLFVVDDFTGAGPTIPEVDIDVPEAPSESDEEGENSDEESGSSSSSINSEEGVHPIASASTSIFGSSRNRKAPAWQDPDDVNIEVSISTNKRLRKLRDAPSDDILGGKEYERRLRRQFEKINGTPEWAAKARKKVKETSGKILARKDKRRRDELSSEEEEGESEGDDEKEGDEYESILASTGGILGRPKSKTLAKGILNIERLRDANISARSEGAIKALQFHPSSHIPILLTASEDRRLRLFNIDGHTNPHLQTLHIPSLPITTAIFHPSGTSILLTGPRPFYYTYDLQTGTSQKSPRGLWGTTFANGNAVGGGMQDGSMEICAFDPSGEVLAVAGRRGYVHLVDWKNGGGSGQVVGSVKMNSAVKSVWWSRGHGRTELMTLGEDAEIYIWDVAERRCVKRWKDDGGYGSQLLSGDRNGQYVGIGSRHGLVNMYGSDASSPNTERPKLLKTINNLTTSITSMRFNHDSQLLAVASNSKKDQMRMIHLPSLTAFSNWPTSGTPLGHVTSIDFSTGSEYVAIGNSRGRCLLYNLHDFSQS